MNLTAIGDVKPSSRQSVSASEQASIGGDFNTFLKMLTVQMQNQDPLNPMESSEFAVQLATFSSVEQQVRTNDFLAELVGSQNAGLGSYTDLIGTNVRAKGSIMHSGAPVSFVLPGNDAADSATVLVSNEDGTLAATAAVSPSDTSFEWSGALGNGTAAPTGLYTATVRYSANGEEIAIGAVEITDRVVEVRFDGTEVQLMLSNGATISPSDVTSVSALHE